MVVNDRPREMTAETYAWAKALLANPLLSDHTLRMIRRELDPEFTRAARRYEPRCVHCGGQQDPDIGYVHSPTCPVEGGI